MISSVKCEGDSFTVVNADVDSKDVLCEGESVPHDVMGCDLLAVCKDAARLILKKDSCIRLEHITKGIQDELKHASRDVIHVAYCDTYGGFGLSQKFKDFISSDDNDYDDDDCDEFICRTFVANKLIEFGHLCIDAHPDIARALRIYMYYDLDGLFKTLTSYINGIKLCDSVEKNLAWVCGLSDAEDGSKFGTQVLGSEPHFMPSVWFQQTFLNNFHECIMWDTIDTAIAPFTKNSVVSVLTKYLENLREKSRTPPVENKMRQSTLGQSTLDMMTAFLTDRPTYVSHGSSTFSERVELFKESQKKREDFDNSDPNNKITLRTLWGGQKHVCASAMEFVMQHLDVFIVDEKIEAVDVLKTMAFLFADGRYCKLAIACVPQYVSWVIKEYDGLEKVVQRR